MHISPGTVSFLRGLGHDAVRVSEVLPPISSDESVIAFAVESGRAVLTQDLDCSALVALSGASAPSIVTLRLASARVERVNAVLENVLPLIEEDVHAGALVTIEDHGIRSRSLPLT